MKKFADWAIKKLGGYTRADVLELRSMCASMADEFGKDLSPLVLRGGECVSNLSVVGSIYVIGDYVNVSGCMFWVGDNATAVSFSATAHGGTLRDSAVFGPPREASA